MASVYLLDWAEIPAEVKRRAAAMTPSSFEATDEDAAALREAYGDEGEGHSWARHLRGQRGEGLELSRYRFTRVVKLYDRIRSLEGEPRYSRFFAEAGNELTELERHTAEFLQRAGNSLMLAERLRALHEGEGFDEIVEIVEERREEFAQRCREIFIALALFRAVLRSEASEEDIVRRLRQTGFAATEPMNLPQFPIDSLTVLAVTLFLYLILGGWIFSHVAGLTREPVDGLMMACKITLVRVITIGLTVWLMQRFAFFHRMPGDPPHFFAYLMNGFIAAVVAFGISLPFDLSNAGNALTPSLLSFPLCATVALCCDDWLEDATPPPWLRLAEAVGCASVMAASVALLYFGDMLTFSSGRLTPQAILLLIALPSGLALVIGGYVPHIYSCARRAAIARRDDAEQLSPPTPKHPRPSMRNRRGDRYNAGLRTGHTQYQQRSQEAREAARHKGQQVISGQAPHRTGAKRGQSAAYLMAGKDP
jgi:hypothetical protein